jgi:hypothetical protein
MALRTDEQRRQVRYRRVSRLTWRHLGRVAITLFLCWHFIAIAMWTMPQLMNVFPMTGNWARTYLTTTGFNQGWTMFSPDPYSLDVYVECRIHYADGTVRSWNYPRMYDYNYWTRYQKERWRKYVEVASTDNYRFLWPTMGTHAARVNNLYPNNPPVSVDLIRHTHVVPSPIGPQNESRWATFEFATVPITSEDLR